MVACWLLLLTIDEYWQIVIAIPEEDCGEQKGMFQRAKERINKLSAALQDVSADIEGIGQYPYVLH
jgi:hypothetical protein